jgi:hypothetical protein
VETFGRRAGGLARTMLKAARSAINTCLTQGKAEASPLRPCGVSASKPSAIKMKVLTISNVWYNAH